MADKRLGIIELNPSLLLELLGFNEGDIPNVFMSERRTICVVIENPEMELIPRGQIIPFVHPIYTETTNHYGKVVVRQPMKDGKPI